MANAPDVAEALLGNLLVFGRLLRTLGLEVHLGRLLDIGEALRHVNVGARDDVYHTCRALLVHRHEDLPIFDRAFDAFWRVHGEGKPLPNQWTGAGRRAGDDGVAGTVALELSAEAPAEPEAGMASGRQRTWSDASTLAHKDFAEFTPDEKALARQALDRLVWTPGERRTHRWVRGRGPRVDLRRALAHSVRTGGDVFKLPRRRRRTRPRPLVLLCDVSGSMDRYARVLLQFTHALRRRNRRDRKSTRLNSSHQSVSRMPSSA